jgi:TetR/AcrR family transcriptional regulator, regulator of biofilm formation and stress response
MASVAGVDTRERILRRTLDLIGREGIGAVTNRRVAAAAETSLGSITYHFESQSELLRESLALFIGEEIARLEGVGERLRRERPSVVEVAREVERFVSESDDPDHRLAELELHLRAARDPELQEASRRVFDAYESVAILTLEMLGVPEPARRANVVVSLMYGMALRRFGTGRIEARGMAEALLIVVGGQERR